MNASMPGLAAFLHGSSPIDLLQWVSAILSLDDDFSQKPAEFFEAMWDNPAPETTAVLWAAALLDEDKERVKLHRAELARRDDLPQEPTWLAHLEQASVVNVIEATQYYGDVHYYTLELSVPHSAPLTVNVSIDLAGGNGSIYDCFLTEANAQQVMEIMSKDESMESFGPTSQEGLADFLSNAIWLDEITVDDGPGESWPTTRPLLRWVLSLLDNVPATVSSPGIIGRRIRLEESDNSEAEETLAAFLDAVPLKKEEADAAETLLSITTNYTMADLYHWSPLRVEMALTLVARKVMASDSFLRCFPRVLTKFVTWTGEVSGRPAHIQRQLDSALKEEGKRFRKELEAQFDFDSYDYGPDAIGLGPGMPVPETSRFDAQLDDSPLPSEDTKLSALAPDVIAGVKQWDALITEWFNDHPEVDPELLTSTRRLLSALAHDKPKQFSSTNATVERSVAALLIAVSEINAVPFVVAQIQRDFDLRTSPRSRADTLHNYLYDAAIHSGRPLSDYLISHTRRSMMRNGGLY